MKAKITKLNPNAVLPAYAHGSDNDAGMDLYAVELIALIPGRPTLVKTGISIELAPGYCGRILERSGLALKYGIRVGGGVIDPSYRGEIGVVLTWDGVGTAFYSIAPGDRIAQLVIQRYEPVEWEEESELTATGRGAAGFGSTGK